MKTKWEEAIEDSNYLLAFQKKWLIDDIRGAIPTVRDSIINLLDEIFFRLFGQGWEDLSVAEQMDIKHLLKELGYDNE